MPGQSFRVFISAVTNEFHECRDSIARELRRKGLEVRDQYHFSQGPGTLLQRLRDYIKDCHAVILVVGRGCGGIPVAEHVREFAKLSIFLDYQSGTGNQQASYTQWEFLFAKHYGKDTYFFLADDGFQPAKPLKESADHAQLQQNYIQWIKHQGQHRDYFSSIEKLIRDVLVLNLPTLFAEQEKTVQHKGLHSYGPDDATYYLDLLPGDHDRVTGLPESVSFWKRAIERTDPLSTFRIGMIYGPSGCGKSSLVKAGILPNLSVDVKHVCLEATPQDTEIELLRRVRSAFPSLPADLGLVATLAAVPKMFGPKLLIAIDQFEQWLRVHRGETGTELVQALAHCDGARIQAVILVREEFFLQAQRFLEELGVLITQKETFTVIDLFPKEHARTVLIKFGRSFGKLAADDTPLSAGQNAFLNDSIDDLSTDDRRVAPVRLALFAEMVKSDPWTPETLKRYGGAQAIGTRFLEEKFDSPHAPEHCRQHRRAAMSFLKLLISDSEAEEDLENTNIKKQESESTLRQDSPYAQRPADFDRLKQLLDKELRLITPTDPMRAARDDSTPMESSTKETYYQLTHDYLVPSLREWLTRRQKETRKGRAELKLAERSALWKSKREDRHLPSVVEWLRIRALTDSTSWTETQRKVMQRAGRVHGIRTTLVAATACILIVVGVTLTRRADLSKNQAEATRLVEGLLAADTGQVSTSIASLKDFHTWADPQLKQAFENSAADSAAKLHAGLALVAEGQVVDPSLMHFLGDRLLTVAPAQFAEIRKLLGRRKAELIAALWQQATDEKLDNARRLHAACALASFDPTQSRWSEASFSKFIADQFAAVSPVYVGHYQELLRPVAARLVPALSEIFQDPTRGKLEKSLATTLLADYAADDIDTLTELVLVADATSDEALFPVLQKHRQAAVQKMEAILDRRLQPDWKDAPRAAPWTEPSAVVRAKIEAAHGLINDEFAFCQDMPWDTFLEIVETLRPSGYRPTKVRPFNVLIKLRRDAAADPHAALEKYNVAAIWTRDSTSWQLQTGVTKDQYPASDSPAFQDGMQLCDLAPIPTADPSAEPQFVALWSAPAAAEEQRRALIGLPEPDFITAHKKLTEQGFVSQCTITVRTDSNRQRLYSAVFSNQGAPSELRLAYTGFELVHQPQWDVAISPSQTMRAEDWSASSWKGYPDFAAVSDETRNGQHAMRLRISTNDYDETRVSQRVVVEPNTRYLLSGWVKTELVQVNPAEPKQIGANLSVFSGLDEPAESSEGLLGTNDWTYQSVVIDSESRSELKVGVRLGHFYSSAQGTAYFDDVSLLELNSNELDDPDISKSTFLAEVRVKRNLLRNHGFESVVIQPAAALWRADVEFESKLLAFQPIKSLTEQIVPLLAKGWRPFAIAVDPIVPLTLRREDEAGADITAERDEQNKVCSMVLHRPMIHDESKEQLALQQSAAATALLRLDAPELVWPLLHDQPDPRLRSYLLQRLSQFSVDPAMLVTRLAAESDVSRRRFLILSFGELGKAGLLSDDQQTSLVIDLAQRYADDPDCGVHGAAEWALKQLGAEEQIFEVRTPFSTGEIVGDRRWYLTKTGQGTDHAPGDAVAEPHTKREEHNSSLTFAILDADEEFFMGSPVSETERYLGPTNNHEMRHRRRIGRRFAIAAHEVTVAQFKAFRSNHEFNRTFAREDDAPANNVSWYDAVAYCNWLSEQEGIPREQWCYDPDQPFQEGMTLLADYLQRTGYRLPSEAEWEFACRSGTATTRYFGETETLLGEYGWYTRTSGNKWMLPVGSLKPNGAGLFDMQGNVLEWCQDQWLFYDTDSERMGDNERSDKLSNDQDRVLRGGSYQSFAASLCSATRIANEPDVRFHTVGFRVARTYR